MKKILLVRHSNTEVSLSSFGDFDRPLSTIGIDNAKEIAGIVAQKITADKIVTSSAIRAFSTARYFADAMNIPLEAIIGDLGLYEKGIKYYSSVVSSQPADISVLLLVGHNPVITHLVAKYTGDEDFGSMSACGVVCIEFETDNWEEIDVLKGKIAFFEKPFFGF
ncbi:MAG: histidine phosphatase family protein [Ignavibacteria bacterium]|jgi:phosphohistidine phosphatase|nr:histidine phosphatase family protein [Ignavibacteria bacterium]